MLTSNLKLFRLICLKKLINCFLFTFFLLAFCMISVGAVQFLLTTLSFMEEKFVQQENQDVISVLLLSIVHRWKYINFKEQFLTIFD